MRIEPSVLRQYHLDQSIRDVNADDVHQADYGMSPPTFSGYTGQGVIVGILDTGIDWQHEDFINDTDGTSRISHIWDQTLEASGNEQRPDGFSYGVEYTREQINDELDGSPTGFVRTKDDIGHGTHVAGIAAGDGSATGNAAVSPAHSYVGMAPRADIIAIRATNVANRDFGFSQTEQLDAIEYLMKKGDELGKPVVLNLSLGGHFGPHDGTELESQAIDAAVNSGKIKIVVSAGNEGTDADHGAYIHAEGTVSAGASDTTEFVIPTYTANSGTFNDFLLFNLWYQGDDRLTVKVVSPRGYSWSAVSGSNRNATAANTSAVATRV
jgi:subtilisin family serine protease